tara:strand:- start:126 stop:1385 length:1260 start_codon:yes stop_codon:yes gene_type:complete
MFALVDCNNFYASCERVFRPNLRNKPIVVLSNNDGCVIARSNEAKVLGVPMGAPAFKHRELFLANKINVFSSNFALYGDMSSRVMNILSTFTPDIEIYSVDEAFLNLSGFEMFNLEAYGKEINYKVTKSTGISISVGIAPTKSLTKVATRIAKKFPNQTKGVYIIDTEEKRIKALKWIKVGDVWGIGRRHEKRLIAKGIKTAYDFTQLSDVWVKKHMAIVGIRLKKDLEGIPTIKMEDVKRKKSIATTRTFERNHTDIVNIQERVSTFAVTCAEKLRKQKSACNAILVFIHTNGYRKELQQYGRSIVVKTDYPTNSSIDIVKYAVKGLKAIYKEGYQYKKAGVIVMDLTPENQHQLNLFLKENPKHKALMKVVDDLNQSIGQKKLKLACQDLGRTWKMKQEKLSPRYTTRLDEIITINT